MIDHLVEPSGIFLASTEARTAKKSPFRGGIFNNLVRFIHSLKDLPLLFTDTPKEKTL